MQTADMWLMANSKYFGTEQMSAIQQAIATLPEQNVSALYALNFKDPTLILIMSILFGELGVDRFMLGDIGMGIGKLLTLGGCLVWWLIDIFLVMGRARQLNYELLMQTISQYGGYQPQY